MMRKGPFVLAAAVGLLVHLSAARARPRDPAIEALVSETGAVPPEFAADVLIRLGTSDRIADPEWKRELLELAYMRASVAHEAYRRSAVQVEHDTRAAALLQAYDVRLDRVSLEARAALGMLPIDGRRAHEMFEWIDPRLDPASCDDPLVPNADEYYGALVRLALAERGGPRGDDALYFLGFYLGRARLPSEMPAVVRAIRAFQPSPFDSIYLDMVLRFVLDHAVKDARGFSTTGLEFLTQVSNYADEEYVRGTSPSAMLGTVRSYLVNELHAGRCSDSVAEGPIASTFNALLMHTSIDNRPAPIAPVDMQPLTVQGVAKTVNYWRTAEARRLLEDLVELRGTDRRPVAESVRRTLDWERKADTLLSDIDRWASSGEPAADFFYQKTVLLALLLDTAPQQPLRARAARAIVDQLRHSTVLNDRPPLWFLPVARLMQDGRPEARRDLMDALDRSAHPVLALYAHLDSRVPPARREGLPIVRRPEAAR